MAERLPFILDVDTGIDDAVALALAVASPEIELLMVATVAGNVGVEQATDNTKRVMSFLGAAAIPIHRGASHPLARPHRDAVFVHGTNGLGNAELPPSAIPIGVLPGPAAMSRLVRESPGEITLVCVGPLTNLAIALNVIPELPAMIKRLVIMGGAYRTAGNITPFAEFNIWVDPEAAAQVFAAPFPDIIAVGLDVSQRTALTREAWDRATAAKDGAAAIVARVAQRTFLERKGATFHLHDPLALAVAIDPTLVECSRGAIEVSLNGDTLGRTTFTPGAGDVQVATTVDSERFLRLFETRLQLEPGR